jgi:drug/metabolite transporter (DMT)-like permease
LRSIVGIGRTEGPAGVNVPRRTEREDDAMAAVPQRAMTIGEWGLLLLLSPLWGGSFFFVGVAVRKLPPLTIVTARVSLAAALSYALASIFARRFRGLGLKPIEVAAGQVSAASLLLAPLAFAFDRPWDLPTPSLAATGAVVAIASLSTALTFIVYFRILAGAGATNAVLVTLLAPATSILLGAAFLGERLAARHFAGLALIAVGLAFIDGRLPGALRARASLTSS